MSVGKKLRRKIQDDEDKVLKEQMALVDNFLVWSTRLLVVSLPIMLFNPINPAFHRLQISDLLFVVTLGLFLWQLFLRKIRFPSPSLMFFTVVLFIFLVFLSACFSSAPRHSVVEVIKIIYLFLLAALIYSVAYHYELRKNLWKWTSYGFLTVVIFSLIGIILLFFNVHTFLAYKTNIIPIALGMQQWLSFVPRVSSILRPTGNMTAAYMAGMILPCLVYYFNRQKLKNKPWIHLIILIIIGLIGLLTMSRAFVGVLLALYFGLIVFKWLIPLRRTFSVIILFVAIVSWLILLFFTVLYPVKFNVHYSSDPHFKKELVVLKGESRPNPVYFMRKGVGLEKVDVSLNYAFNHYAWLKYGGLEIFKRFPWFGVGLGNYPIGMKILSKNKVISPQLVVYRSAQSQYATLLAEIGAIGVFGFLFLVVSLFWRLSKQYSRYKDPLSLAVLLSLIIIAIIAINVDVIAFRWLWGIVGLALVPPVLDVSEKNIPPRRNHANPPS